MGVPHSGGCLSMRSLSTALVELREAFKSEDTKGAGDGMERGDLGEGGEGDKMLKIWCIWSSWKINWKMVLGLFVDILFHFIDCEMCLSITKADTSCAVNHGRSYAVSLQCFFLFILFPPWLAFLFSVFLISILFSNASSHVFVSLSSFPTFSSVEDTEFMTTDFKCKLLHSNPYATIIRSVIKSKLLSFLIHKMRW